MKVFLDDERTPNQIYGDGANDDWVLVATVEEVFELLKAGGVTHLSLDNDLGIGFKEGHTIVPWMIEHNCWPTEEVFIHTANLYWAPRMLMDVNRYFYNCIKS